MYCRIRNVLIIILVCSGSLFPEEEETVYFAKRAQVVQVVDERSVLARPSENSFETFYVTDMPTKDLYNGSSLVKNIKKQVKKYIWIHPGRIRREVQTDYDYSQERCRRCNGRGRLSKRFKGELGNRICSSCDGSGQRRTSGKSKKVMYLIDGLRVK